ncbi:MAG: RES domain-containing protein [bacterium]
MLYCCPNCFTDIFLQNQIRALSKKQGNCSFCKTKNTKLIKPIELIDRFEPLLNLYEKDNNGLYLNELIQSDWKVFQFKNSSSQKKLLNALSDDFTDYSKKYRPILSKERKNIEQWESFREELKHHNRFFPKNAINLNQLEPFGKYLGLILKPGSQKFYRARLNTTGKPIVLSKMGKPPNNIVSNGRANPLGISYLYVASTIDTAIAEIRGQKGELITVAEFELKKNLELADLRDPIKTISPFDFNSNDELELIYKNMPFLILLGNELSKPVMPREANLEYLPSQYLSELFKHIGFHGIIYRSSISDGNNYVIFEDKRLKPYNTYQFIIKDVQTFHEKI